MRRDRENAILDIPPVSPVYQQPNPTVEGLIHKRQVKSLIRGGYADRVRSTDAPSIGKLVG
jgi:hypothetical protein